MPDISELRKKSSWRAPSASAGISGSDIAGQIDFAANCIDDDTSNVLKNRRVHHEAIAQNGSDGGYGEIEAEFLYAPSGNGNLPVSSKWVVVSLPLSSFPPEKMRTTRQIICVDPYPTDYLKAQSKNGLIELIAEPAQEVDLSVFTLRPVICVH